MNSQSCTGQTLLVVEDNASTRIALEAILEALDIRLMAGDAREAQALYQGHGSAISLVMSDLIMPETSGPGLHAAQEVTPTSAW